MKSLTHQRCFHHSLREAAARCPECGRFYCRECITEHEDRVLCAACLRRLVRPPLTRRRGFVAGVRTLQLAAGVFTLWLFFYLLGQTLLSVDTSVHEGTVWRGGWLDQQ
jgi:hypothetical protein